MENHEDTTTWVEQGKELAKRHHASQWEVADWLVAGAALYRDQHLVYDIAEELFPDYTRESLRHFAVTARAFPPCTRVHANLTFGHYRVAQALPDDMATDFLALADGGGWPVSRLRAAVMDLQYGKFHPAAAVGEAGHDSAEPPRKARTKPTPKVVDAIGALPVPYATQLKLKALAKLYKVTADELLRRVVDTFLEVHADDVAVTEQIAADQEDAYHEWEQSLQAASFQRIYGMPEQDWEKLTPEEQKIQKAEMDQRRRQEQLVTQEAIKRVYGGAEELVSRAAEARADREEARKTA